jgi:hypothetical protein
MRSIFASESNVIFDVIVFVIVDQHCFFFSLFKNKRIDLTEMIERAVVQFSYIALQMNKCCSHRSIVDVFQPVCIDNDRFHSMCVCVCVCVFLLILVDR